jgi:hypothetical protein
MDLGPGKVPRRVKWLVGAEARQHFWARGELATRERDLLNKALVGDFEKRVAPDGHRSDQR